MLSPWSSREPFDPIHGDQQDPFLVWRTSCWGFPPADTTGLTTALISGQAWKDAVGLRKG